VEFRHDTGELSLVHIDLAGMSIRRNRLANLPPEVPDRTIREVLSPYGEVKEVYEKNI
jgi:RNA recognition motif-containing protein